MKKIYLSLIISFSLLNNLEAMDYKTYANFKLMMHSKPQTQKEADIVKKNKEAFTLILYGMWAGINGSTIVYNNYQKNDLYCIGSDVIMDENLVISLIDGYVGMLASNQVPLNELLFHPVAPFLLEAVIMKYPCDVKDKDEEDNNNTVVAPVITKS